MTLEQRVAALSAERRERLAGRLRRMGALSDTADSSGKRLVAYVVARPDHEADPAELRGFLRARLPEHMVPSAFVTLDEFPRTASGKLDRRALPAPELSRAAAAPAAAAPSTPAEAALAGLWAEVLGLDSVQVDQDFYALGGDSILLLKLCARAREAGWVLAPYAILEHSTIAELAAHLGAGAPLS